LKTCPHCHQLLEESVGYCPHCGEVLAPPVGKMITGKGWLDTILGVLAVIGSLFLYFIGVLAMIPLYFVLRQSYPHFARGVKIGLFTTLALLLGALALCFYGISTMH
jgi:hypothetical protein